MAQATTSTGAESIRWDLTDLFASPTDPAVEALMARTLEMATAFEAKYRRKVATLPPPKYAPEIDQARKFRPHQLTEPEERVLTDFSPVGNSAWVRLFEELCAGIRMEIDGKDVGLEEALTQLHEPDREVRRRASTAITGA